MLIAQISDTHIRPKGVLAMGRVDTAGHLARAVAHIMALRPAPDVVLVTGDLVDAGMAEEYAHLRELLAPLPMPVHLIPGNHDLRDPLRAAFTDHGYLPRDGQSQAAADEDEKERFGEHERQDRPPGESERLQHGQLAGALAHRLRHRAGRDEPEHEEDDRGDGDHDGADVADLLRKPLDESLFGGGLGFRRRVREHLVERPAERHRLRRIGDLHHVPADQSFAFDAVFVEIVVAVEGIVFLAESDARPDPVVCRRCNAVEGRIIQLIAGQLFNQEPIVRLVLVERFDDVIAEAPGGREIAIVLKT